MWSSGCCCWNQMNNDYKIINFHNPEIEHNYFFFLIFIFLPLVVIEQKVKKVIDYEIMSKSCISTFS
jgi:hypothetical protein